MWRGVLALVGAVASYAHGAQDVFMAPDTAGVVRTASGAPTVHGRFAHITDLHADVYYRDHTAVVSSCHHNKPRRGDGGAWRAGHWGTPISDCDAPRALVNASLAWLSRSFVTDAAGTGASTLDFILWTGDSARHDQDSEIARTQAELVDANMFAMELMQTHFPGIPIVPNIGNNDVLLHNTMLPGPSEELEALLRIWRRHIPDCEVAAFRRGGYYARDLIPNRLGVLSLNTLYFFDSNKAAGRCARRRRRDTDDDVDAGTLQLEWVAQRLADFRRRNMQVYVMGHVPPTAGNYFARCYDVYTELILRFQDTIVGQHFGHMNLDAFFVQESSVVPSTNVDVAKVPVFVNKIEEDLRHDYESLPGSARTEMDYYGVFNVGPSIVPTYLPSVRVWTYNTTLPHDNRPTLHAAHGPSDAELQELLDFVAFDSCPDGARRAPECDWADEGGGGTRGKNAPTVATPAVATPAVEKKQRRKHSRPTRKHRRELRKLPRYASETSPSRMNTYLTPLGYSQWVLDLDRENAAYERVLEQEGPQAAAGLGVHFQLEYATYKRETLWHEFLDARDGLRGRTPARRELPSQHHVPVPKHLLLHCLKMLGLQSPFKCRGGTCRFTHKIEALSDTDLPDMTLRSVLDHARSLVLSKKNWKRFVRRMYSNSIKEQWE
ncbi:endopolyphosphatase [Malassezia sp. CBS 17886]|nr:endopolyphosphatase [Malassezia sp. CBS 17886]